eukprot:TRINITY_DN22377_c0_g1_i1.p1 TRINITY_DN22377_c0_g1~~TRINITY_DN22377_c0_g1_i1.p1  ORF type:complete len:754 (-),score=-42.91 TRINITY_DN22377_c0_g1_i1:413-2674(-)
MASLKYTLVFFAIWPFSFLAADSPYCSGHVTLSDSTGTVTDTHGGNYIDNMRCSWLIQPNLPTVSFELTFIYFNTESGYDLLDIRRGPNATAPRVAGSPFSGLIRSPWSLRVNSSALYLLWMTDVSVTRTGFAFSYLSFGPPQKWSAHCAGGYLLTARNGNITDHGQGGNYLPNTWCYWLIRPSPAVTALTLTFDRLSTEGYDGVSVFVGSTVASPQVSGSPFSGNTIPSTIYVPGSVALVSFVTFSTSVSPESSGFALSYSSTTVVPPPPPSSSGTAADAGESTNLVAIIVPVVIGGCLLVCIPCIIVSRARRRNRNSQSINSNSTGASAVVIHRKDDDSESSISSERVFVDGTGTHPELRPPPTLRFAAMPSPAVTQPDHLPCVWCINRPAVMFYKPCGHRAACSQCFQLNRQCPLCESADADDEAQHEQKHTSAQPTPVKPGTGTKVSVQSNNDQPAFSRKAWRKANRLARQREVLTAIAMNKAVHPENLASRLQIYAIEQEDQEEEEDSGHGYYAEDDEARQADIDAAFEMMSSPLPHPMPAEAVSPPPAVGSASQVPSVAWSLPPVAVARQQALLDVATTPFSAVRTPQPASLEPASLAPQPASAFAGGATAPTKDITLETSLPTTTMWTPGWTALSSTSPTILAERDVVHGWKPTWTPTEQHADLTPAASVAVPSNKQPSVSATEDGAYVIPGWTPSWTPTEQRVDPKQLKSPKPAPKSNQAEAQPVVATSNTPAWTQSWSPTWTPS